LIDDAFSASMADRFVVVSHDASPVLTV